MSAQVQRRSTCARASRLIYSALACGSHWGITLKVSRNEPCPCGSGIKFKKCHGRQPEDATPPVAPEVLVEIANKMHQQAAKEARFGRTRLPNSTLFKGRRMIGVGNTVHRIDPKRFPCDFMNDLLMDLLGRDWGNGELAKPLDERHPVLKWYDAVCKFQKANPLDEHGVGGGIMTGPVAAWYKLGYDLWVLSHHAAIRDELIDRLKKPETYQSARYEITIAALFVRAGFDLTHEQEDDNTRKHPEFIATHVETGERVAVEAKSRHRVGVLGFGGAQAEQAATVRAGLTGLVRAALIKKPGIPFVACVDMNVPPIDGVPVETEIYRDAVADLEGVEFEYQQAGEPCPANLIVLTNYPHHYGSSDQPDPRRDTFITTYHAPLHPFANLATAQAIMHGLSTYGPIPTRWEDFD